MDQRALVGLAAVSGGLVLGSAIWLMGSGVPGAQALAPLAERVNGISVRTPIGAARPDAALAQALSTPLFALTAIADVALKLDGLVRSPNRVAALISINGAPSDWLDLGQTRDGVTLAEVSSTKVVVDTPAGLRDVNLGDSIAAPSLSEAPPGFRSPPPPASAPGSPR